MKKQILLISLMVFSIQSLIAQDAEVAQPGWWQQKQEQAYDIGQKGWEKTKEGIAWIKANPKKAAAIGLGVAMIGTKIYQAKKHLLQKQKETLPAPEWVQKAREERKKLQGKLKGLIYVPAFAHKSIKWDPTQALRLVYALDRDTLYHIYRYHLTGGQGPMEYNWWGPPPPTFNLKEILQKTYINGYSAISAVIVAEKKDLQEKQYLIGLLLHVWKIIPTPKDCMLSKLELWERSKAQIFSDIKARIAAKQKAQSPLELLPLPLIERIEKYAIPEEKPLQEESLIPLEYCTVSPGGGLK